jgi:DNA-binding transcriptional ArsR family regulator
MIEIERDYGKEIDEIKKDVSEIKEAFMTYLQTEQKKNEQNDGKPLKRIHPMRHMSPDERLAAKMSEMCDHTDEKDVTGLITYLGVFSSDDRQSNWIKNEISTDELLELVENKSAEKVLACIGSGDRLNILLSLLRKPKTVAELVESLGFGSTGQVYHHLKPLLAADLIFEVEQDKGRYAVSPHRVQGIVMLLAGISDMLDPEFSQGTWDEREPGADGEENG